jgi:hypothetical protein
MARASYAAVVCAIAILLLVMRLHWLGVATSVGCAVPLFVGRWGWLIAVPALGFVAWLLSIGLSCSLYQACL